VANKKCALNYDGYKDLVLFLFLATLRFHTSIVNIFRVAILCFDGRGWKGIEVIHCPTCMLSVDVHTTSHWFSLSPVGSTIPLPARCRKWQKRIMRVQHGGTALLGLFNVLLTAFILSFIT